MAIPDFQSIMLPLLKFLGDQQEHRFRDTIDHVIDYFRLTEAEKAELLPSGQQPVIDNRVGWAKTYMLKAGLLESTRRGYFRITARGLDVLHKKPAKIDIKFLDQFQEFVEFRTLRREQIPEVSRVFKETDDVESITPDELMETGFNSIQASLGKDILDRIRSNSPAFFERVVLDLLASMGYGEGKVTGRSGDGGIDGFISQDRLGLERIMFQAKRFGEGNVVTPSMVRDFLGALDINAVSKGVFMTTSKFTGEAEEIVRKSQKSVVLIDRVRLVKLLIDFNIGVLKEKSYEIKRIDTDYFAEE